MRYEDELKRKLEGYGKQNIPPNIPLGLRKFSKLGNCIALGGGVIGLLGAGIGIFVAVNVSEYVATEIEETIEYSGNPAAFDPVKAYDEVHAHAGLGTVLTEIEAFFVRPDGTMDLTATYKPAPRTTYEFFRTLDTPPEDAPPIGDGTWYEKVTIKAYEPGQGRHVTSMGGDFNMEYYYENKGLDKDTGSPSSNKPDEAIAPPTCHFSQIWEGAIAEGISDQTVANITYDEDGYEFRIMGTVTRLEFDQNCQLID